MAGKERPLPVNEHVRMRPHLIEGYRKHDGIEQQVNASKPDRDANGLREALQKHDAEQADEDQRNGNRLPMEEMRGKWIL